MRAQILDVEALRAVSPTALAAYVRESGWMRVEPYGEHADVYGAEGRPELILPRTVRLGDYAAAVSRLVSSLADALDLDELRVYRDLATADHDVIRVRAIGAADDGTVPVDDGVALVERAQDMLLAAACAARAPQPLYRAGANREATDYMRRVRLGQTEHGSFVVTLLSPVPPVLQPPLDPAWGRFEDEPLERQVTRRLVEALAASRDATERVVSGEGAGAFEAAVAQGVSANLCEAVADMAERTEELEISVTWARTRPTPEAANRIRFSRSDAAVFREVSRVFRDRQPRTDVALPGSVTRLKRDEHEEDGAVTLRVLIDGKPQSVTAVLDERAYDVAVQAHRDRSPVVAVGDLERAGQRWRLVKASIIALPEADDETDGGEDGAPPPALAEAAPRLTRPQPKDAR